MAIRYSGDVEVCVSFRKGAYHASVRGQRYKVHMTLTPKDVQAHPLLSPSHPENYDRAALAALTVARHHARRKHLKLGLSEREGTIMFRRTFQAPCPVRT